MNDVYFACIDCREFLDAGYRWAYWTLQVPGVVRRAESVSVDAVFDAAEFWKPPADSVWLHTEILPQVRNFLETHRSHRIVYGESEDFQSTEDGEFLRWKQSGRSAEPLPRFFAEDLGLRSWDEVCRWVAAQNSAPWWWWYDDTQTPHLREIARRHFEEAVARIDSRCNP